MANNFAEYKRAVIGAAIQLKGTVRGFSADNIAEKIRRSVEFTGAPEKDLALCAEVIDKMQADARHYSNTDY